MTDVTPDASADTTGEVGDPTRPELEAEADVNEDGVVDQDFYNAHEGTRGRPGGVYLDEVERREAEDLRARQEGREPDYENAAATAGTPLVVKELVVDNLNSNPSSQAITRFSEPTVFATLPVDKSEGDVVTDTRVADQYAAEDEVRNTDTPSNLPQDSGSPQNDSPVADSWNNTNINPDVNVTNPEGVLTSNGTSQFPTDDNGEVITGEAAESTVTEGDPVGNAGSVESASPGSEA